jgi:hypothetical protein
MFEYLEMISRKIFHTEQKLTRKNQSTKSEIFAFSANILNRESTLMNANILFALIRAHSRLSSCMGCAHWTAARPRWGHPCEF